jgi:two-component system, NarL family, sensor histidine kinase BarA
MEARAVTDPSERREDDARGESWRVRSTGIGRRMMMLALAPAALMALGLGTYSVVSRIKDLREINQQLADDLSQQMVPAARHSISMGEFSVLQMQVTAVAGGELIRSVRVTDDRGATLVVADSADPNRPEGLLAALGRLVGGDHTRDARRAVPALISAEPGTTPLAWIEVEVGGAGASRREGEVILVGGGITLVALLLAVVLALRVSRQLARPLVAVSSTVDRLAAGTLDARVPEDSSGDLGALERGINMMAVRIAHTQARLEEQVQSATQELRETLAAAEVQNLDLEAARARAEAAAEARSAFLANMSHEIRTPLNAVMGFAGLLDKTQLTPIQRSHLQTIQRSTDTLIRVIDDILNWSQLEAGKLAIVEHAFRLKASVDDALSMLEPAAQARGLALSADVADDLPAVLMGDAGRIRQILINLINNSIKFTDEGEVHVSAYSGGVADEQSITVVFEVSDTGRGIATEDQLRLFEPFEQADLGPSRSHGGTGLGLAICRKLAEAMGGTITLDSAPGQGSTFRLRVPLGLTVETAALKDSSSGTRLTDATMAELLQVDLPRSRQVLQAHWDDEDRAGLLDEIHSLHGTAALCHLREVQHLAARCERVLRDGGEIQRVPVTALISALDDATAQLEYHQHPDAEAGPTTRELSGWRLLIADDNELNRRLLRGLLEQHGATVRECESGREVLSQAGVEAWDALLIDVHMPGLSGCETVQRLRRRERGPGRLPIIAVSADGLETAQQEARDAGVDEYLVKPYSETQLLRVLAELVAGQRAGG